MNSLSTYYQSSIGKKQIVATTGLMLILFIIGHLAGNLTIFLGPEVFNAYAKKLSGLRPGLYFIEFGLLVIFVIHMWVTAALVWSNIKARPQNYSVQKQAGQRSLATRLMPYTGSIILAFVIWHLLDFTFVDKYGARSYIGGESFGLYGIVYNSFLDPAHSGLYIVAMACLGFHLAHGVQSFAQTFGWMNQNNEKLIKDVSNGFAVLIAVSYSAIPLYILLHDVLF